MGYKKDIDNITMNMPAQMSKKNALFLTLTMSTSMPTDEISLILITVLSLLRTYSGSV